MCCRNSTQAIFLVGIYFLLSQLLPIRQLLNRLVLPKQKNKSCSKYNQLSPPPFILCWFVLFSISFLPLNSYATDSLNSQSLPIPSSKRSQKAISRAYPLIEPLMDARGLARGSQVFIRIFKQESELEVWLKGIDNKFTLFKIYPICTFSGKLGPKEKQGDRQSPEGFYYVKPNQLNPWSQFHLSFNLGYPNRFDRAHGRTGDALMVHGDCVSIGCYAMTDPYIEQIYTLMHQAFENGQPFIRVHIFPFKMTEQNLKRHQNNQWYPFWLNLKQGFDWFKAKSIPPNVEVLQKRYVFSD